MVKDKFLCEGPCDGGKPVKDNPHAAAALAQGGPKSKVVPTTFGMKDQNASGSKLTGR